MTSKHLAPLTVPLILPAASARVRLLGGTANADPPGAPRYSLFVWVIGAGSRPIEFR